MSNCIKKSAPAIIDSVLQKYSTSFFQYETTRIIALDPAMKNMGVSSFIIDVDKVDELLNNSSSLDSLIEEALEPEYIARVDLGVELTSSYIDVINVVVATNHFLENLLSEVLTKPVGTTLVLIEKQPETNNATNKIFETILAYFCHPKFRNIFTGKPNVLENVLVENVQNYGVNSVKPVTSLGYTAVIPLEGYAKNSIALYSGIIDRTATKNSKYLQNKSDTSSLFRRYCTNKDIKLSAKVKVDDMADSFCMTVFAIGKLVSFR